MVLNFDGISKRKLREKCGPGNRDYELVEFGGKDES
jgi:hypothetical protein